MTSDHSPVFASFEVGVASQFVSKQGMFITATAQFSWAYVSCCKTVVWRKHCSFNFSDPSSAPQGGIQIMNCVATLLTKSKTKFFIEYHSSCLESMFDHIWLELALKLTMTIKTSLDLYRNSEDLRGRKQRTLRRVHKSLVRQPNCGKVKMQLLGVELALMKLQASPVTVFSSSFPAHPHHLRPWVPSGPAHTHLCEVHRLWRVVW